MFNHLRGGLRGGPAVLQQLRRPLCLWCSKAVQTGRINLRRDYLNFHIQLLKGSQAKLSERAKAGV